MKREKKYFHVGDFSFVLENQEMKKCFGCGEQIESEQPFFIFDIGEDKKDICWKCASLIRSNEKNEIRESEFDCNMANVHRKKWKEISEGRSSKDVLSLIFPEISKVRLMKEEI